MKKLFFLFSAFLMMLLTSCSDERDFGNGYAWGFPLNETDSLAMVKIYKAMGYDSWTDKNNIDLKKHKTWDGECTIKFDRENKEFRIVEISIDFRINQSFAEFQGSFVIPDEVSQMTRLTGANFIGSESVGICNVSALTDCPLEYLAIGYGDISEKDLFEELPKLSATLTRLRIAVSGLSGSLEWILKFPHLELADLPNNEYSGKVPGIFKYSDCNVGLFFNNFDEMDWSYFTDPKVNKVPNLQRNRLHGEIPQEVFDSQNWIYFHNNVVGQQEGYSYTNWNGYY